MQQNDGFDKNQLIGFFVFSALLMGAMFYFQDRQVKEEEQGRRETVKTEYKESRFSSKEEGMPLILQDSVRNGVVEKVHLKNDLLSLDFTNRGALLTKVELLNYKAYNPKTDRSDLPLNLIKNSASYGFLFKDKNGNLISTKDLYFTTKKNGNSVFFSAALKEARIEFIYTLLPNYQLDFKVKTSGLSKISKDNKAEFVWDYKVRKLEKGRSQEQTHSEFSYAFNNYKDYDYDGRTDMDERKEVLNWIGVKQQFFASIIESKSGFKESTGYQDVVDEGVYLKTLNYRADLGTSGGEFSQDFVWYFLPLDLSLLTSYNKNFEEILPLGWLIIGGMNRWFFIPMYNFISSWGIAAGWVIFLMTIIVKLILSPIMYKQHKLSAMMRVIRPEIDEVNEKYKKADPMKKQQEVMAVYRKAGVNQFAGCLPALLQIPIFYALFRFFPNFIELRGKSFWFAKDLTAYDDVIKIPFTVPFFGWDHISIFALACTIVILIYTVMTSGQIQQPQQEGMPNMKILMYIFPVTFFFFLNSAASGLSWYYFVSNAINIIIILVIKYWVLDEKKIHAQIMANKEKPKKEGKFQKRMREMMERAQEQQRIAEKARRKK
ncbi:MAG: membrane protein insertase YidC [Bergeyella sp.]|nr:membrane protein insertase YidC [Bergeyella sp.]